MPKTDKPNILVIWGDDIGIANLSCYTHGLMGYQTPNIDRLAKEGMMFTDSYGEQSCTAGRSSFITGQSVYRTGLSKVGIPGAPIGMTEKIVTIAARSRTRATRPASSARTISAISTSCCRPTTASTSSSATSITSTPRKSRRWPTIPREGLPELPQEVRAARRHAFLGDRHGRPDRRAALGQGRQAEDRGHRAAHQEAHGDLRRRFRRRAPRTS